MNPPTPPARVDEVARHYTTPRRVARTLRWLFYGGAVLSLAMPHVSTLASPLVGQALVVGFLVVALAYFFLSQGQRYYWLPRAERQRTLRLLSDALGATLNHDETRLYYNNSYAPSMQRLGANVMENSLFGSAVVAEMLRSTRFTTAAYLIVWVVAFAARHNDLILLVGVTQFVFSAGIVARWINLEVLHARFEQCFERLHQVYLTDRHPDSPDNIATILSAVVSYEAAKSLAGTLLDERAFNRVNPRVTESWNKIRANLGMDS